MARTHTVPAAVEAALWLREASRDVHPGPPVTHVYHPLDYAWRVHEAYLERYARGPKRVMLVGMNPGPWGMAQTGVPFGDVTIVRDWLGLNGIPIDRPADEHPKRPVTGWACRRGEMSGQRIWGFLRETYGTPERALSDLLIANHCPLVLFDEGGRNITPDKLRKDDRDAMCAVCDEGLVRTQAAIGAKILIGVGAYAEACCRRIAPHLDTEVEILRIPHPSPASPLANRNGGADWRAAVAETFRAAGLL